MVCSWLPWSPVDKAFLCSTRVVLKATLPLGNRYQSFCKYPWIQPESSAALPGSSTIQPLQKKQTAVWVRAVICHPLPLLQRRMQHLSFQTLLSPSCPQSFVNYHLCKCFHPVLLLTKLREEVSVLLQPSSSCLLNNPSLQPTDSFLWRETNILTNTADDIWNYKRAYWVN